MNTVHAIFEGGVFRPLEPVDLPEKSQVEFEPRVIDPVVAAHWRNWPRRTRAWRQFMRCCHGATTADTTTRPSDTMSTSHETGFLDTVGLIALWDEADQWHAVAQPVFAALLAAHRTLVTTTSVLLECGNAAALDVLRGCLRSAPENAGQ